MDRITFEQKIQKEIDPRLYLEDTPYEDIDRININIPGKLKPITICAFPKAGVKEEFDPGYQSIHGQPFPHREMLEAKIKTKLSNILSDLDLYE